MDQPLISVIVPVYNAELYLKKCVDSIRNQTYKNLEIILVNDGSPDHCGEMCDEMAKEDARIRVFHKENGGQSSARNLGLDNMTGAYVGFVDSDDWIEPNMYQTLYELICQHNAQISACGCYLDYSDGQFSFFNTNYPQENQTVIYSMMQALEESFHNKRITYSPCDKLYHASIFADLRFTEGRIYEDMEIIPKCIERTQCVAYFPTPLYHYYFTDSSTIRGTFNPKRLAEADVALAKMADYKIRHPHLYELAQLEYRRICLNIIYRATGVASCNERRKQMIRELRSCRLREFSGNDKIKLLALKIGSPAYVLLMKIYETLANKK